MSKYWEIFRITWQQFLIYRVNFVIWRLRTIMQLLLVYFIWWSVFKSQVQVFGYTASSILTYILAASLIRTIVLSSRASDLIDSINTGSIVNFLIKPLGFIRYFLTRDAADKLFNIGFFIVEISLLILLLKPPVIIQTDIAILIPFFLSIAGGLIIYFCINFIIGLTAFWVESSWGVLFLMSVFLESLGGGLFPLDILPKNLFSALMLTPFPYLIYFPAKLYLGGMNYSEMLNGFVVIAIWILVLILLMRIIRDAGFRHFSAVGN
ncbi:ABC-2 family transporter protein [Candidatus Daviesbacteria bacterium]|nr:ABC-2 family transporter protein [Candidatus Daviesbacteria bacterium]MBI4038642.1 ABC-2 family transporter protein [Candidatus Daviesbacteria bacterium]